MRSQIPKWSRDRRTGRDVALTWAFPGQRGGCVLAPFLLLRQGRRFVFMFEFLDFLRKGKMLSHYGEYWRRQIGLLTAFATPTTETSTSTALSPGNLNADPSTTTNGNLNQGNLIIANKQNPEPGDNFTIFVCGEEEVPSYHDEDREVVTGFGILL